MDIIHDSSAITMMRILTMLIEQPPHMTILLFVYINNTRTRYHSRRSEMGVRLGGSEWVSSPLIFLVPQQ